MSAKRAVWQKRHAQLAKHAKQRMLRDVEAWRPSWPKDVRMIAGAIIHRMARHEDASKAQAELDHAAKIGVPIEVRQWCAGVSRHREGVDGSCMRMQGGYS